MSWRKLLNRDHEDHFGRTLLVLVLAVALLLIQTPNVSAAPAKSIGGGGEVSSVIAGDALCVDGLVINHQEQPLRDWTVTASYLGNGDTAPPQTVVTNRNGEFSFELPVPGRWLFTLALPSDWIAVTDASFEVDIAYGSTDCVSVRFKVQQEIEVIVIKIDDDHTPLVGWTIIATPGPDNPFNEIYREETDEDGRATFRLPPGHWIFSEEAPADVTWWQPVMPVTGIQELVIRAPGPYTIRFKNDVKVVKNGCIQVTKRDVPPEGARNSESFGLPGWPIEVVRANGTVAASGTTDAFGNITFSDLPFGPYTVREEMLEGWEPATPTIYEVVLSRADDDCKEVVFENKQKEKGLCIEGQKVDQFGSYGIPGWEITATPLEAGGIVPDAVVTDGQGKFRIDFPLEDYRVPGSTYEVCEEVRDGWTPIGPTCYTVTLPKYPGACRPVPPFVNRQTNEEHPEPQPHTPKHDEQKHDGQKHDEPKHDDRQPNKQKHNGKQWQPQKSNACSAYHTVKRGESIYSIAPKYGMSGSALMQANQWVRGQRNNWVYVGQQVCIP